MNCTISVCVLMLLIFVSACTTTKSLNNNSSSQTKVVNKDPKFIEDISLTPGSSPTSVKGNGYKKKSNKENDAAIAKSSDGGKPFSLQLKYAKLLDADESEIRNDPLYQFIDDWYGTSYCMGGMTKNCVDCSGFVQTFYSTVYGIIIPRTSKEQYGFAKKISSAKLKEGDLLFFNTRGGVSHVGIYLMNNKFVHASTSAGVTISDLDETYYSKRFISAGRVDKKEEVAGK